MVRHNPDGSITIGRECDLIERPERNETVGTEQTVPTEQTAPSKSAADKPKKRGKAKK